MMPTRLPGLAYKAASSLDAKLHTWGTAETDDDEALDNVVQEMLIKFGDSVATATAS